MQYWLPGGTSLEEDAIKEPVSTWTLISRDLLSVSTQAERFIRAECAHFVYSNVSRVMMYLVLDGTLEVDEPSYWTQDKRNYVTSLDEISARPTEDWHQVPLYRTKRSWFHTSWLGRIFIMFVNFPHTGRVILTRNVPALFLAWSRSTTTWQCTRSHRTGRSDDRLKTCCEQCIEVLCPWYF